MSDEARDRLELAIGSEPGRASPPKLMLSDVGHVLERAEATGQRWVTPDHPEWPPGLDDLAHLDPVAGVGGVPLGVWVRGQGRLDDLTAAAVGIVGARSCTTYGAEVAGDLAADCADAGLTVVSGAAFGIDAQAHRGALSLDRPTIAVLACGADLDYPRAHAALLARIRDSGVIVSEYPPGSAAQRHRFLTRNRLIAAMSHGLIVVEAAERSGSLNTMQWSDQLGRHTMAVPGPVTSRQSGGTHRAIREGKAVLVGTGAEAILELVGLSAHGDAPATLGPTRLGSTKLGPVACRVESALGAESLTVGELSRRLRVGIRPVRRALLELKAAGVAAQTKGHDGVEAWFRAP